MGKPEIIVIEFWFTDGANYVSPDKARVFYGRDGNGLIHQVNTIRELNMPAGFVDSINTQFILEGNMSTFYARALIEQGELDYSNWFPELHTSVEK